MSINLDYIEQVRGQIIDIAEGMLDGKRSYIEGSRLICDLIEPARLNRKAPFVKFVVIASETDNVPIGELRDRWYPEAKIKLEQEWANSEQYAKTIGEGACKDAIAWLMEHPFKLG